MNDIHKRGGTILGTSRGGHDTSKIVDSIQDRGINQVCSLDLIVCLHYPWHGHQLIALFFIRFTSLEEMEL